VRQDLPALSTYLTLDEATGPPRLAQLLAFALGLRSIPDPTAIPDDDPHRLWPLQTNAARLLSSPPRSLLKTVCTSEPVFEILMGFPTSPRALHPKFAGHFTQILKPILAARGPSLDMVALHFIIDFAIEHIDVLAYQSLLFDFLAGLVPELDEVGGYKRSDLVRDMLRFAASHLLPRSLPRYDPAVLDRDSLVPGQRLRFQAYMAREKLARRVWAAIPGRVHFVPLPAWAGDTPDITVAIPAGGSPLPGRQARYQKRKSLVGRPTVGGTADAEVKAFLSLSALRTALSQNLPLWPVIQSSDNHYAIIQLLLICGIYGPPKSIATGIALKILKLAVYGSPADEWNIPSLWENADVNAILSDYAQDFEFRLWPTPQMRDALPLFWNHRYSHITSVGIGPMPELHIYDVHNRPQPVQLEFVGMTPLELYGRYLVDDPPLSDLLNIHCQDALLLYEKSSKNVRRARPPDERRVLEMDGHFLNLMRTPFLLDGKPALMKDLPCAIGEELPIQRGARELRAPVSGWARWFAVFSCQSDFLTMDDEPLGDVLDATDYLIDGSALQVLSLENIAQPASLNLRMDLATVLHQSQDVMARVERFDPAPSD
jgi:hypothetical protein